MQEPLAALKAIRKNELVLPAGSSIDNQPLTLSGAGQDQLEYIFKIVTTGKSSITLGRGANELFRFGITDLEAAGERLVEYGHQNSTIFAPEKFVTLHLFIDVSVLEIFIDYQLCITADFHGDPSGGFWLAIESSPGSVPIKKLQGWELSL